MTEQRDHSQDDTLTSPTPGAVPESPGRSFDDFSLPREVREGIRAAGFTHCTEIQEQVLPLTLPGQDVAGQAQTGTGKTAAFLITLFTRLLTTPPLRPGLSPRALVIAPTRELAVQIDQDAALLGQFTGLTRQVVYGGVDYAKQRAAVREGVNLLIGTPGRLIDYFKQRVYTLQGVQILVVDEADRMFDMGFIKDLRFILRQLPPYHARQSMLFSATLSSRVLELAYEFMNNPVRIAVRPEQVTVESVEQLVYHVGKEEKLSLLLGLLKKERGERILIFVNMRHVALRLARQLAANGYTAKAITGDVDQKIRLRTLAEFKSGALPLLIATDVASRGLHIEGVSHVINYDLPQDADSYVHRIGRTARAGASGKAISLACEEYVESLPDIEAFVGYRIPHEIPDDDLFLSPVRSAHPPEPRGRGGWRRSDHSHRPRRQGRTSSA